MEKFKLTKKIMLAMLTGILIGLLANGLSLQSYVNQWLVPFGTLFLRCLKFIAIFLVVFSLATGISELGDTRQLKKLAGRTITMYVLTTVGAVLLGLCLGNVLQPGSLVSEATRLQLLAENQSTDAITKAAPSPLQLLIDLVPELPNVNMLYLIGVTVLLALAILSNPPKRREPLVALVQALNGVTMTLIDWTIRYLGPIGVMALMAKLMVQAPSPDMLLALLGYACSVVIGLAILAFVFYPFLVRWLTQMPYQDFVSGISPLQLVAIATSSSAATLPVTIKTTKENLGVSGEVANFVLPIGATVNMDATSMLQSLAALFIAQVFGIDLSLLDQLAIVIMAVLASIGAAAVPSAGVVLLSVVLPQVGLPLEGIALIIAIDRPLDMLRTAVNVTGDAAVAVIMNRYSTPHHH